MKLYYHKTSGGAEYLMNTFIKWSHEGKSGKEGVINDKTKYLVRIDGDITKDSELIINDETVENLLDRTVGEYDYLLQEGVILTKKDKDRSLFLAKTLLKIINEMREL